MLPTALYVSRSGTVWFGDAAIDAAQADGRTHYDSIKDALTHAEDEQELDASLTDEHNPTGTTFTKAHALVLYLAFFTQAALRAYGRNPQVTRSIAIPVFSDQKASWVSGFLRDALGQAHALARRLGDRLLRGVDIRTLMDGLRPPKPQDEAVVSDAVVVPEPVAAVAAHLLNFSPDDQGTPGLIMVVDIGAGTTDIAMFASGVMNDIVTFRHVARSKRSLAAAGKAMDGAVVSHFTASSGTHDTARTQFEAGLLRERGGAAVKEELFRNGWADRMGTRVSERAFLESQSLMEVKGAMADGIRGVLLDVDRSFFARNVVVRFSGGGASLPFLREFVQDQALHSGSRSALVKMGRAAKEPLWRESPRLRSLYQRLDGQFHRMAVSLGGAFIGAEAHEWLRLSDDIHWLGRKRGPIRL